MSLGGVSLGSPTEHRLDALLRRSRVAAPSYAFVGASLDPDDVSCSVHSTAVGRGDADFRAAREALQTWVPQRSIGAEVRPHEQRVENGATLVLVIRRGPLFVVARNRVIDVVDEPRRFAYAYGTLPGHPERGEEAFILDLLDDGTVRMTIRVRAGASTRVGGRLASPLLRSLQTGALRRYLRAVERHVLETKET